MPHNKSGSLENSRIPAEGAGDEAREKESTANQDITERVVNAIWLDYLGVPYVPPVNRDSDCDMGLRLESSLNHFEANLFRVATWTRARRQVATTGPKVKLHRKR